jgi:hypothetical protein
MNEKKRGYSSAAQTVASASFDEAGTRSCNLLAAPPAAGGAGSMLPPQPAARLTAVSAAAILWTMPVRKSKVQTVMNVKPSLRFSPINAILLVAGIAAIVLGYELLSRGSITAAPLLLVLGYAVLIPLGIIR